jgi:hypothetical protein
MRPRWANLVGFCIGASSDWEPDGLSGKSLGLGAAGRRRQSFAAPRLRLARFKVRTAR